MLSTSASEELYAVQPRLFYSTPLELLSNVVANPPASPEVMNIFP